MGSRLDREKSNNYQTWLIENRYKLITIFGVYQLAILSIGIVNFPYIDDIHRQLNGHTGFAKDYTRLGSEVASWLVQGSRHLTDMGLATHILTGLILGVASILAVYVLNDKKLEWMPVLSSLLIGLNPWFLQCISFRFDSPYMALSILVSFVPFFWWCKSNYFFSASIVGLLLMCNTYQGSSGIYIVMVLALLLKSILANEPFIPILKKVVLAAMAYILAMLIYMFETKLNPEMASRDTAAIATIKDIPVVVPRNITDYFTTIIDQSARIWLFFILMFVVLFLFTNFLRSSINPIKNILTSIAYLFLGSILSYGAFLVSAHSLILSAPRYGYGFSVFVSITLIILTQKVNVKSISIFSTVTVSLFIYYIVTFTFVYSSALNYQKEAFQRESIILTTDLQKIVNDNRKNVYMNRLFRDSPVLLNSSRNYPILLNLIPRNEGIYWPNVMLFNTFSGLDVNIQPFDFNDFDKTDKTLEITSYHYDIFSKEDSIYIFVKN